MLIKGGVSWDKTADIVVIGCGCGGVVAAITATENGAETIILEKQPRESHHTNSSMSGGIFIAPTDAKSALEYMTALCQIGGTPGAPWTDRAVTRAWAEYAATLKEWIAARGGNISPRRSW